MVITLDEIKAESRELGIFLSISGPLSQNLMVEMGETLKRKMKLDGATPSDIHKVLAILVELNQNIIHYSAEKMRIEDEDDNGAETGCGIMTVGCENQHYFLMSGNLIENSKVGEMKERLTRMSGMNTEELNRKYRKQRKQETKPGSKGAGLGLIDVARKVSEPLVFDFEEIDSQLSFFTLKTIV